MSAAALHTRLDKVRHTGTGKSQACCPAHNDRRASLSIRELDDGRTLVHCFAGCSVEEILAAVGLDFADLYPDRPAPVDGYKRERRPFLPADAFHNVIHEVTVVSLIASDLHAQKEITEADHDRLHVAVKRLNDIAEAVYGR